MEQTLIFTLFPGNMIECKCTMPPEQAIQTVLACVEKNDEVNKIIMSVAATICKQYPEAYNHFRDTVENKPWKPAPFNTQHN